MLIAIDDLQWADRVSRFLLRSLVSRLAGQPVVWMFASRDDPIGIDLAGHDIVRREYLQLAPLTTSDLAAMARDRLGRVPDERTRRYLDATGGNPFLATQIIDSLARSAAGGEPDAAGGRVRHGDGAPTRRSFQFGTRAGGAGRGRRPAVAGTRRIRADAQPGQL